jgi:hypothetical protein
LFIRHHPREAYHNQLILSSVEDVDSSVDANSPRKVIGFSPRNLQSLSILFKDNLITPYLEGSSTLVMAIVQVIMICGDANLSNQTNTMRKREARKRDKDEKRREEEDEAVITLLLVGEYVPFLTEFTSDLGIVCRSCT